MQGTYLPRSRLIRYDSGIEIPTVDLPPIPALRMRLSMKSTCWPLLLCCTLAVSAPDPTRGQEWTRFRGPNGSGISQAATIPVSWTTKDYKWWVKLPGIGYSSPVIWGERIFVTSAIEDDATRIIRCLRTSDGGLIWKHSFPSTTHSKHQFNCYASASPVVDEHCVYLVWATPREHIVMALDQAKGRQLWRRDLGPYPAEHGFGASPIIFDDKLILTAERDENCFVIALDRKTGLTRWKTPRRVERAAYATPIIYRPENGPPQLILASSAHGVSSLDPQTGKANWELGVFKLRVVGSPTMAGGLIFASCGSGGGGKQMVAVRPGNPAEGVEPKVAYEIKGSLPYVPIPVAYGSLLFLWSDQGIVTCLDVPTGKIHWRERVGGKFFGSPVCVRDRIYCISREGEMVVLAAADQYKLLARFDLEERSNSTPAIADGVMYLRTVSHLMAIGGTKQQQSNATK